MFLKSGMNQDISHTSGGAKAHPENVTQPESPMQEAVTVSISMDISDAFVRKPLKNLHAIGKKRAGKQFGVKTDLCAFS